jgi:tetratricopeptide (TPR) repeat protein
MEAQNHPKVGIATVFISHAWLFKFLDVVNALEYYFRNSMDTIVWFDLFSNNQHIAVDLNFDWWCNTFRSAIQDFGSTLMILAPYDNPIPLTRGWCIFELYCTFITQSSFQVAMCENDSLEFFKALEEDVRGTIDKMLAKINARNSHCFKTEDKERIFEAIERTVGFNEINKMVFERLRDWVVRVTRVELDRRRTKCSQQLLPEEDVMVYVNILAELHRHQGNYASALPLYQECLAKQTIHLGVDHPDTLSSMSNLAGLYERQGDYASALPLYQECLAKRTIHLGVVDRDTLRSMNCLANLYTSQGDYASALPLHQECLAKIGRASCRERVS